MINYKILIGGIDYTSSCSLPFKEQYCLDESLDNAVLNIKALPFRERIKPYTIVSITKDNDTYSYYVANDNVTEIVGTGVYNHDLTLIEETKLLEKLVVDTNTITQPLLKNYEQSSRNIYLKFRLVSPEGGTTVKEDIKKQNFIKTLNNANTFRFPSARELMTTTEVFEGYDIDDIFHKLIIYVAEYDEVIGQVKDHSYINNYTKYKFEANDINEKIRFDVVGTYACCFTIVWKTKSLTGITAYHDAYVGDVDAEFQYAYIPYFFPFSMVSQQDIPPDFTITDTINKLLSICETQRYGETPKFSLNNTQAQEFSKIVSPEFSFTKSTLRECLDQVASYLHCITRMGNGIIYFDKLGEQNEVELPKDYISYTESQDIEQYCSAIDTNVENLVNLDKTNIGTIVEPFAKGYETVRAEEGQVRITDETAIIETEYPIEKVLKLEVGFLKSGEFSTQEVGDITAFVYENAEYQTLSSISSGYGVSKAYALYYTQGQKGIKGLGFKLPNPISSVFENFAIINILEATTQEDLQNLINVYGLVNLNFRVTYIPVVSARIKQTKTNYEDFEQHITSIYNQGANKVDSNAYGENLKGAVARLGNIEKFVTFKLPKVANLLNVGDIVDNDYYISTISIENLNNYIKVTYGLSKDFNRLNKYIGIKNNLRMYEVSEKQSVERYVIYEDYCVVGDEVTTEDSGVLGSYGIDSFANDFTNKNNKKSVSNAILYGLDNDFDNVQNYKVLLPTVNFGMGNSIVFTCAYKDNYSAGNKSEPGTNQSGDNYYKVQNYVPYADYWGRIKYLHFALTDSPYDITNFTQAQSVGDKLPEYSDDGVTGTIFAWTILKNLQITNGQDGYPIILEKDNREKINFSYQIHFITNDKDVVIGSGFAKNSGLVNSTNSSRQLYLLSTRIGKFDKVIDTTNAVLCVDYKTQNEEVTRQDNKIKFDDVVAVGTQHNKYKSWVIVDSKTKELIYGKNTNFKGGDTIELPTLTFVHKIY